MRIDDMVVSASEVKETDLVLTHDGNTARVLRKSTLLGGLAYDLRFALSTLTPSAWRA